jgi:ATP/maltotriose-dependent transcriptional regulator MalT
MHELTGGDAGDRFVADVATLVGDHETAADRLRADCARLKAQHHLSRLSTFSALLGRSVSTLGRYTEAARLAQRARSLADEEDLITQVLWRQVEARVCSFRGRHADAESLARDAVRIAERTDGLDMQGDAFCDLALVLSAAGRGPEVAQALERYERKRNLSAARSVQTRLAELRPA